ncbi:MAG: 6-bladed beta-propeller [Pyrinomonadaceae bacterium]
MPSRVTIPILIVLCVAAYFLYIHGIDRNPPGFYLDEATISYNAYRVFESGSGEFGHFLPLYFPVIPLAPPFDYLGYAEPVQVYILAAAYHVFSPTVAVSRGLSATAMFIMAMVLGWIAAKLSKSWPVGWALGALILLTPWFFEIGRLTFSASLYPLTTALLLATLFRASRKENWSIVDILLIAISLALTTYTYAIGRLLGPLFAVGLILFWTSKRQIAAVFGTWIGYALTLVPMLVFHLRNPNALTGRLNMSVGYISADKSYGQIFSEFLGHYWANIYPTTLLVVGDLNPRHHIPGAVPFFAATALLALIGILVFCSRNWRDQWWRFVIFGLIVSVIPASLTKNDFHMLRLSPFPVFLIVLAIPAIAWLATDRESKTSSNLSRWLRLSAGAVLLISVVIQAWSFFSRFNEVGPTRLGYFDSNYASAFAAAIERPERPIYLTDQYYYQAFWQAIVQGVDRSNFARLEPMKRPPANSLVLSGEERCSDCEMIFKDIPFVVYKTGMGQSGTSPDGVMLSGPRGIAVDASGNYFVADTGNARIVKFSSDGKFVAAFGTAGEGEGYLKQPHGITTDATGRIYVTDSFRHKLLRYRPDGSFEKEWNGPDSGFYGPRDIEAAPNGLIYIVDQGRTRIARFDPKTEQFTVWGTGGSSVGQFRDPSGIAVTKTSVYVADLGNQRVQVFDLEGEFRQMIPIPQWGVAVSFPDVAVDERTGSIFITSPLTNEILVFNDKGSFVKLIKPDAISPARISSIAIAPGGSHLLAINTAGTNGTAAPGVIQVGL